MAKVQVKFTDYFAQTIQRMREDGLLLVSTGTDGKANVMTIGWGTIGCIWSRPVFIVLVRPSRYTYSRLEQVSDFTVNVPPPELADSREPLRDGFRQTSRQVCRGAIDPDSKPRGTITHYQGVCRSLRVPDAAP